jgi:hypothetical protein
MLCLQLCPVPTKLLNKLPIFHDAGEDVLQSALEQINLDAARTRPPVAPKACCKFINLNFANIVYHRDLVV